MAFKKKTWIDRMVEYAGRRKITNVSTLAAQIVDVERAEGAVSEEGTAINAANMNDFEQRTADAFSAVQQDIEGINSDLTAMNDSGAIKGMDARKDGVYITYVPTAGADAVTKKLGSAKFSADVKYMTGTDTTSSFGIYTFSDIDVTDYSKLQITSGTMRSIALDGVTVSPSPSGDYYPLNGSSLTFAIIVRPYTLGVAFELIP